MTNRHCPWCAVPFVFMDVRCHCKTPCTAAWCVAGVEIEGSCP